jgi:hypothetical protein
LAIVSAFRRVSEKADQAHLLPRPHRLPRHRPQFRFAEGRFCTCGDESRMSGGEAPGSLPICPSVGKPADENLLGERSLGAVPLLFEDINVGAGSSSPCSSETSTSVRAP